MTYLIIVLVVLLAYLYGCLSTARIVAKTFRSLNIYKVGTGLADTENIYSNVSKPMGILVGTLDVLKALVFLTVVRYGLYLLANTAVYENMEKIYSVNTMLIYGLAMLIGHCLPVTNRFQGGRGIFTYIGFVAFFAPVPMLITVLVALVLVARYKQIRFAQYVIVILPVILTQIFYNFIPYFKKEMPPYFSMIIWGIAIIMGVLNYLVSKKLGEL
ncbi:MAG TPA: glycerol-3-phosphate acyltransferase [Candidatus Cloacimonadota bacterium]|jgi:glycerol-3-phosphate acyltransferase PlsY|nr:glycerol-3-phosphate acyltransferase [Candidatus Cloacimonadota bacterium]HOG30556.1 glycerol-3-phosphate acyltransferase [Candidatus Cloacimonadota bacterium]HOR58864.1 glycerol-3-phosphate acyltransferase [Candidatus Cloacimonadota bacterium]HPB08328.1 glycerol-3-phosphate acyltransferase [Candidatus Cloacimonadota bacterium]HPL23589.1 glycerol-3-phosphate acyltransferase [Candidatus Cloacimonadota bacterium]